MPDQDILIKKIETALDTIRQYLKDDGGDVEIIDVTESHVVRLRLLGACSTCPQSYMTMKAGIEETIKKAVPEVKGVIAVNPYSD